MGSTSANNTFWPTSQQPLGPNQTNLTPAYPSKGKMSYYDLICIFSKSQILKHTYWPTARPQLSCLLFFSNMHYWVKWSIGSLESWCVKIKFVILLHFSINMSPQYIYQCTASERGAFFRVYILVDYHDLQAPVELQYEICFYLLQSGSLMGDIAL